MHQQLPNKAICCEDWTSAVVK